MIEDNQRRPWNYKSQGVPGEYTQTVLRYLSKVFRPIRREFRTRSMSHLHKSQRQRLQDPNYGRPGRTKPLRKKMVVKMPPCENKSANSCMTSLWLLKCGAGPSNASMDANIWIKSLFSASYNLH